MRTLAIVQNNVSNRFPVEDMTQDYSSLDNYHFEDAEITGTNSAKSSDSSTEISPQIHTKIHPVQLIQNKVGVSLDNIINEFSGVVLNYNVGDDYFLARLVDVGVDGENKPVEEAEILLVEVDNCDLQLVLAGAEFSWYLTREKKRGRKQTSSIIKFRRIPEPTQRDINYQKLRTKELVSFFTTS